MESYYDFSPTEENKKNLCAGQKNLEEKLEIEENYWKQKNEY